MADKFYETFFIAQPIPTDDPHVYLNGESRQPMKWSADLPIPQVGDKIFITMNGIGWAHVKGYFESCGYVGVMTLATNPPTWLRQQHRRLHKDGKHHPQWILDGIGCEFGAEIALKRPAKKAVA